MSQPAVSQNIKALEKELGCLLFNRSTKKLALTADGEKFYGYALKLNGIYDEMIPDFTDSLVVLHQLVRILWPVPMSFRFVIFPELFCH